MSISECEYTNKFNPLKSKRLAGKESQIGLKNAGLILYYFLYSN